MPQKICNCYINNFRYENEAKFWNSCVIEKSAMQSFLKQHHHQELKNLNSLFVIMFVD